MYYIVCGVHTCVYMHVLMYEGTCLYGHTCTLCIFAWKLTVFFDHFALYLLRQKASLDPEPDSWATVARQLAPGLLPPFLGTGMAGQTLQTLSLGSGDPNSSPSTCSAHALCTILLPQHVSRLLSSAKRMPS